MQTRSRVCGAILLAVCATALAVFVPCQALAQAFSEIDPGLPKSANPCVVWADYNGDGYMDVLVAGVGKQDVAYSILYNNTGTGTFTNSGITLLGLSRATAAWGDFDNDGDLDLAMTGLTTAGLPTTRVYRNDGTNFAIVAGTFTGVFVGNITWADYDGDGDLDLLITGVTSSAAGAPALTRLYRNDGGTFASVSHPFPNCYLGAVAWADYDKDGDLDVVIAGATSNGGLVAALWRNEGNGVFVDSGLTLPGMDLGFAIWGDYDSDGDLDLAFGGNSNDGFITRIYRNDGGTFVDAKAGLLPVLWSSAAWGDYDNDGDLDLIVVGYDPAAQVHRSILYRNDAGTFVDSGTALHNVILGTVSWIDYDNDGDLDLSLAGNENGLDILSLYRNNNAIANTPPTAPTNLVANVLGTSVDLSWNTAADLQTPSAALTYNVRIGTTPGGAEIVSPQSAASGVRRLAEMGNQQEKLSARISNLRPGTNYFWSVQAVDGAFAGSAFATEGQFTAQADLPVLVSVALLEPASIHVTWHGTPGSTYQVSASTNLSDWIPLATPTAEGNGLFDIVDPIGSLPARFYRATR